MNDSTNYFEKGLLAVNITKDIICKHSFIAYIDKNFHVRNYFTADFQIEIQKDNDIKKKNRLEDKIDLLIFKINIYPKTIIAILKGILSRTKVLLIHDDEFLFTHFKNFFKYITQTSFKTDIDVLTSDQYQNKSNEYSNQPVIIIKKKKTIQDSKKIIKSKEFGYLKNIINKFLSNSDLKSGAIILKNDLQKAFEISKYLIKSFENQESKKTELNSKQLIDQIEDTHNIEITSEYLDFIYNIIENFFEVEVPKGFKSSLQLYLGITSF